MWGRAILSAACAGVVACGCGGGDGKAQQTPDQVATAFVDAWNRHDAAAVCSYYTDAAKRLYAQATTTLITGRPKTCAHFIGVTQFSGDPRARWQVKAVVVHGDEASVTVTPANRHTPFLSLGLGLVKTSQGWQVGGGTLNADSLGGGREQK